MLIAVACCPQPPMLVPELSIASDPELDALRAACAEAVDTLFAAEPERLLILGGTDPVAHGRPDAGAGAATPARVAEGVWRLAAGARGDFADFGVDLRVRLDDADSTADGDDHLPLSLLVGGWLLRGRPASPTRGVYVVDLRADAASCDAAGRRLAGEADRVGMLVMADGATHDGLGRAADRPQHGVTRGPADHRRRAEEFDARVAAALAAADIAALAALDADEADAFAATGRAAWQVLAGAAAEPGGDAAWSATSHYIGCPYEVGYAVASWVRAAP